MHRIEYDINLTDLGRPCIDLPVDYEHRPEDRFFAIELARYVLQDVYNRRSAEFDSEAAKTIDISIRLLGQVGDSVAEILWNHMKVRGDNNMLMYRRYHILVNTIEERDYLSFNYILEDNAIYKRSEGLKVLVIENNTIYELKNGISNADWTEKL